MEKELKENIAQAASLTLERVLDSVLGLTESFLIIAGGRKEVYRQLYYAEPTLTYRNFCKFIDSMKRRKYIEIRQDAQESIVFTNKARLKVADKIVKHNKLIDRFLLVSFDIPEYLSTRRNNFRKVLKRMGFKQIQRSLWVTDKDAAEFVELASIEYKVEEYVASFIAEQSSINKSILGILSKSV
ncbi:MAG: CRISPR-associated endonuclease Cas2 [Patescibacteria group bacterium]|jgi:CRISPR-associated endonuclease Cas2